MHIKHLGTDQYAYGSILALLCYVVLPGLDSPSSSMFET